MRGKFSSSMGRQREKFRLTCHALEPPANRWIAGKIEAADMGFMGISKQRDVGDGLLFLNEKCPRREMLLHHTERLITTFKQAR